MTEQNQHGSFDDSLDEQVDGPGETLDEQVDEPVETLDEPVERPEEAAVRDPRIAAAVGRLDSLAERPPAEHVDIYDEVHAVLQDALAEAQGDSRRAASGGAAP